jgi:glucose dehydrogenase
MMFRAIDSRTGKELWSADLDGNAGSTPLIYLGKNPKQYVAIVGRGGLVTFTSIVPRDSALPKTAC